MMPKFLIFAKSLEDVVGKYSASLLVLSYLSFLILSLIEEKFIYCNLDKLFKSLDMFPCLKNLIREFIYVRRFKIS